MRQLYEHQRPYSLNCVYLLMYIVTTDLHIFDVRMYVRRSCEPYWYHGRPDDDCSHSASPDGPQSRQPQTHNGSD